MTDYSELKRLAEALNRAIAQAEHKPGEWAETAQSMGGICYPGEPFQIGKPWAKEEPWASFSHKRDSWLAVAAVNALPELLELIAENDLLGYRNAKLAGELSRLRAKHGDYSCGPGANDAPYLFSIALDMSTCTIDRNGEPFHFDSSERYREALTDAERYRWLRSQHWNESDMVVACHPKKSVKLGFDCPSGERLDHAIDAAMGKGEQP